MAYVAPVKIAVIAPMTVERSKSVTMVWIMIAMAPWTAAIRIVNEISCVWQLPAAAPSSRVEEIPIVAREVAKVTGNAAKKRECLWMICDCGRMIFTINVKKQQP